MEVKGALVWKLKLVMDKCQIGTVQLAEFLGVNNNVVSKWRRAKYMPQITEKRYVQIVAAINKLCEINGRPGRKILLSDLIEFSHDEERDFDILEYQYQPGNTGRGKSASKKKSVESGATDTDKEVVAA